MPPCIQKYMIASVNGCFCMMECGGESRDLSVQGPTSQRFDLPRFLLECSFISKNRCTRMCVPKRHQFEGSIRPDVCRCLPLHYSPSRLQMSSLTCLLVRAQHI